MTEPLVSKEQAIALKELGFCFNTPDFYIKRNNRQYNKLDEDAHLAYIADYLCACPTVSLALKFMREKYGVFLNIHPTYNLAYRLKPSGFAYNYINNRGNLFTNNNTFDTYEEAESAGLDRLIEIAKQR